MNKLLFILFLLVKTVLCTGQKLYTIFSLKGEFSGISTTDGHNKEEFKASVPKINGLWRVDVIFHAKKIIHKISLEESVLEKNFRITNKFLSPPNTGLGISIWSFGTGIDQLILGYSLQKEGKKEKGFLFHSRIRFNYSVGLGFGFNRSKSFYQIVSSRSAGGWQDPHTYGGYEAFHNRDGMGIFIKSTGGVDFVSKKGKRIVCLSLFYNQGLKQMVHYNIHYQYGFWNDPSRQVDVPNQVLRNKGTTFGFSAGFPITFKK